MSRVMGMDDWMSTDEREEWMGERMTFEETNGRTWLLFLFPSDSGKCAW